MAPLCPVYLVKSNDHCGHIFGHLGYKYSLNVADTNGDTELQLAVKAATTLLSFNNIFAGARNK
jgi:hypothetical protein